MPAADPFWSARSPTGVESAEIDRLAVAALADIGARERRFLVVVPDATRKLPLPTIFSAVRSALSGRLERLDALIAQGTHPAMDAGAKRRWVLGPNATADLEIFDHDWDDDEALVTLGTLSLDDQLERFGRHRDHAELLGFDHEMAIRVNRRLLEYDRVILLTRVQPHEVAGYAGGAKQIFPGASGPEMIELLHAIGSLHTNRAIHGVLPNPVRDLIDDLAALVPTPLTTFCLVLDDADGDIRGIYAQNDGWRESTAAAAALSAQINIHYAPRRVRRLIAAMPRRPDGSWVYPDLWTGAKGMLKTEDVVADGGELVVWAPNIDHISAAHGELIRRIGYHSYAYFFAFPERWQAAGATPLALNGSALMKGEGRMQDDLEYPRIDVRIATAIPPDQCRAMNIGYEDPATVAAEIASAAANTIEDDRLVVHDAGDALWRHRPSA